MLRGPTFRLLGVPIRVEIWFVISILFLGLDRIEGRPYGLVWLLEWFVVAAVSILVHEFGHAFAYRRYGQRPAIVLWGLGGLTYGEDLLPPKRSIVVSLAGPLAEILVLGLPALLAYRALDQPFSNLGFVLYDIMWLNIAWALVNLLPILPLDGGHIAESILELIHGEPRRQTARLLSVIVGIGFGLFSFVWWKSSFGLFFGLILALVNGVQYYQVRKGTGGGGGGGFDFGIDRDGQSGGGAAPDNVVSMDKARRTRDRRSPAELISEGYDALERRDYAHALRVADRLQHKRLNAELEKWTAELAAFAWLGQRNPVKAAEVLAALPDRTPSLRPLAAVLLVAEHDADAGVALMVDSMVHEPEGGPKLIAVDLFAEYGMIHRLARELVDLEGGSGFEAAVALESMLHRLNRTQDASTVSDVILLG